MRSNATERYDNLSEGRLGELQGTILCKDSNTGGTGIPIFDSVFRSKCRSHWAGKPTGLPAVTWHGAGSDLLVDAALLATV